MERGKELGKQQEGGMLGCVTRESWLNTVLRRKLSSLFTALLSTAVTLSDPWMGKTDTVKKVEGEKNPCKGRPLNLETVPVAESESGAEAGKLSLTATGCLCKSLLVPRKKTLSVFLF